MAKQDIIIIKNNDKLENVKAWICDYRFNNRIIKRGGLMEEYLIFTGVIIVIQWALAAITRKTIKYYMPFMGYYYVIKHIKEETESEN